MSAKIRELPSPRWIIFFDIDLAFIPYDGKLWLSQSDIRAALAEPKVPITSDCLYFPDDIEHIDARKSYWFFKLELARHTIKPEPYFKIPAIRYFTRGAGFKSHSDELHRRLIAFEGLLDELAKQCHHSLLMHSHICGEEAKTLRSVLDKHPHCERVLELWNRGETEGVIAEVLQIKVTKVRSAMNILRKNGFDVLNAEHRDQFAATNGRARIVPRVRLSNSLRTDTVSTGDNTTSIHHDP